MYTYAQRYVTDTVSVLMSVNLLHTVRAFCWCKNNHSWPEKKTCSTGQSSTTSIQTFRQNNAL